MLFRKFTPKANFVRNVLARVRYYHRNGSFPLPDWDSDSDSNLDSKTLWLHSIMQNMFPLTQIQIRIHFP